MHQGIYQAKPEESTKSTMHFESNALKFDIAITLPTSLSQNM